MIDATSVKNEAVDTTHDVKNQMKDAAHDVKNNVKDAFHEVQTGNAQSQMEDAKADEQRSVAQITGDPSAAMRAEQHDARKEEKNDGVMDSVKESLGDAAEAVKDAASGAMDSAKKAVNNMKARM